MFAVSSDALPVPAAVAASSDMLPFSPAVAAFSDMLPSSPAVSAPSVDIPLPSAVASPSRVASASDISACSSSAVAPGADAGFAWPPVKIAAAITPATVSMEST